MRKLQRGIETFVPELPDCDICKLKQASLPCWKIAKARYDGVTKDGPWAWMCEEHWKTHSYQKLGTGMGQRLIVERRCICGHLEEEHTPDCHHPAIVPYHKTCTCVRFIYPVREYRGV